MLFSQARKRAVVNTSTATRVARVEGFVVLPGPARVALLRLGKVSRGGSIFVAPFTEMRVKQLTSARRR